MEIDVTKLASYLENDAGAVAAESVYQSISSTPWGAWMRLPIISNLTQLLLKKIFIAGFKTLVMQSFFLNTAIRKASQAQDYITATKASQLTAIDEETAKLREQARINAFKNLVMVTR